MKFRNWDIKYTKLRYFPSVALYHWSDIEWTKVVKNLFTLKMFLGIYKSIKNEYLSRSPRGKWLFVRNIGIFALKLMGNPILDPNYRVYWYSFAGILVVSNIFLSHLYTWWYYSDSETPIKGFLITPLYGTIIPVNYA